MIGAGLPCHSKEYHQGFVHHRTSLPSTWKPKESLQSISVRGHGLSFALPRLLASQPLELLGGS